MSTDLNDFDERIQEQLDKLSDNLKRFSELQEKAEYSKDTFDKATQSFMELESESKAKVDKYDKQFNIILREVNMRMEELNFLRDKLTGAQRDFTVFADKRIEDHKEAVDIKVSNLANDIKDMKQGMEQLNSSIDKINNLVDSSYGTFKKQGKKIKILTTFSTATSVIFIALIIVLLILK